ncbi:MAG TPA: tRNA threonylcarbamoyladenosine dehydratase [Oribacterium sp.]|jgi:tRNA A37 threonylcarbamoyladenosine dehydratase|nr:tRNA threonylcarbamoyladenosine dehydratase [Oribacterium sp.]
MKEQFIRTELLFGREAIEKLQKSHVAVFGVGGVGGYVCETLARCGVGELDLIDKDDVSESNINRQIIATHDSIGRDKVDVMMERILAINPDCVVHARKIFFLPDTSDQFDFSSYDYVVDAVDNVTAKIQLVMACQEAGTPIICSMGAGNKLDPTKFQVADIYKTSVDPLARVMRRELKKRHVKHLKVVYSTEEARKPVASPEQGMEMTETGHPVPGSVAFVPSVCGLIIGGEVVKDLTKEERERLEQN